MAIKVNPELLVAFEAPLMKVHGAFIDTLVAIKGCQEAVGTGLGLDEALERNGVAMEKVFNDSVVPGIQTTLNTLAASAENAEAVQRLVSGFEAVNTSKVSDIQVKQGVRPAAFGRG